ncbi:cubilin [Plakobranchus ocellatus]|uniref:Cubilin n=1 Tax=Plakobranchus ocellatus TaxID=259542 RepID=A0AAV4APX3_9GAST|nr:cubilin [Plakobranchus ocellatus]
MEWNCISSVMWKKAQCSSLAIAILLLYLSTTAGQGTADNCGWRSSLTLHKDGESVTLSIQGNSDSRRNGTSWSCHTTTVSYAGSSWRHLQVQVDKFELKGPSAMDSDCYEDSERVIFTMHNARDKPVTWCGGLYAEKHIFPTRQLNITYKSGIFGQGDGFVIKISSVLVNTWISGPLQASDKPRLLLSPNYPADYDSSLRHSVTLEGYSGNYFVIRILKLDIEDGDRCKYDYLSIDNEKHCGRIDHPKVLVIRDNSLSISFRSDISQNGQGFALEYASYPAREEAGFGFFHETIDGGPKLYHVSGTDRQTGTLSCLDQDHSVLISFIGVQEDSIFSGIITDGSFSHHINGELKHFWSKRPQVKLELTSLPVDGLYMLIESVTGHGGGLHKAENTIAWLQSDDSDQSSIHIYLPKNSPKNINVMVNTTSGVALHNGPDLSYFDFRKGCFDQNRLSATSFQSDIVTVEIEEDLWNFPKGLWMHYSDTGIKKRNMFCLLEVPNISNRRPVEVKAETNLKAPYRLDLAWVTPVKVSEIAKVADLSDPNVKVIFSSGTASIKVWIPEPPSDSSAEMSVDIDILSPHRDALTYPHQKYLASTQDERSVPAPYLLIIEPLEDCVWYMDKEQHTGYWQPETSVKLTVYGASVDNTDCGASLELYLQNGDIVTYGICGGSNSELRQIKYVPTRLTIKLKRSKWVDLPDPLFSYVTETDAQRSCRSEITLDDGEDFEFSSKGLLAQQMPGNVVTCEMKILPKYYDSQFRIFVNSWQNFRDNVEVTVTGFEPGDVKETPLREITLQPTRQREYIFRHMALKLKMRITVARSFEKQPLFDIGFRLQKETGCMAMDLYATEELQYITSPNYPLPYDNNMHCHWRFSAQHPLYLEIVDMDIKRVSYDCSTDYIRFDDGSEICGSAENKIIPVTGESGYGSTCCFSTVTFHSGYSTSSHRGFMLRYSTRQRDGDDFDIKNRGGSGGSSSSKTGVAVGASIASILIVLLICAAVALYINYRRKIQQRQRQRARRNLRNASSRNAGDGNNNNGGNTSSVFIVGPMVGPMIVNTSGPPPPYPGLSDGESNYTNGYYTNPDGGYTNSNGQFATIRGNRFRAGGNRVSYQNIPGQEGSVEFEEPPPYHPLMPGSPLGTEDHTYHPLARTRDSGISDVGMSNSTLYSVAQSTTSDQRSGNDEEQGESVTASAAPPYSLAGPVEGGEQTSAEGATTQEPHYDSVDQLGEAGYAVAQSESTRPMDPPPYEAVNPPHPPPAYEFATLPDENSWGPAGQETGRGPQNRSGRLGPL